MDILSLAFIVLVVLVVGSAWLGLRSNWRSIQSMRSGQKAALDDAVFDLPEGPDCSHQHGHGHDAGHQGGDATGTSLAISTWATTVGSTEVAGVIEFRSTRDQTWRS